MSTQTTLPSHLIPQHIRNSPLLRKGGFDVFEGLLDSNGHQQMLTEAVELCESAQVQEISSPDCEDVRGGHPPRCLLSTTGGSVQQAFYTSGWMLNFLHGAIGIPVTPTGGIGTYTYYARPGDYLALHRDIETCDLAIITCLHDNARTADSGGVLCLYPERHVELLSTIRSTPECGSVCLRLMPGQTIVMFGGIIPHAILPVIHGQIRIVSVLCYRV